MCVTRIPTVLSFAIAALVAGCGSVSVPGGDAAAESVQADGATIERIVVAMGTSLHVTVTAATRAAALEASEAGVLALEAVDARLSTWRDDSELMQLNRLPVGRFLDLSGPLLEDLRKARRWQRATGGAFDPAIGALVELYQFRDGGRWPSDQEVWACLPHCDLEQLHIVYRTAERKQARLKIEEGGFGKGAGLDAAARAVLAAGAASASFDFGGQVLHVGTHASESSYDVASPFDRGRAVVRVRIDSGSLATTANSERRLSVGDLDLGHILDPRTGRPAEDFGSVTVWADDAFTADCLSTGLFVMGPDAALAWAEQQEGVEVLVLEARMPPRGKAASAPEGGATQPQFTARTTSGLRDRVTALVPDIALQ